jgi:transglutaminase-like putative cysteine protease
MYYNIRHVTRFRYSAPISESIMEVRIQPRSENNQHCLDFRLHTSPRAHIMSYRGEFGNRVHHFDVPNYHSQLTITAAALVDISPPDEIPMALDTHAWEEIDQLTADDEYWDFLKPSRFAAPSGLLYAFMREHAIQRRDDPLTVLRDLNTTIYQTFEYMPKATRVDSPIDDALRLRRGVCQDFAHIMITLVRQLGIPCRYVSGYLFHQSHNRASASSDATHAWVEALLPSLGWIGLDPTNNTLANERHIRVAIGRDYADVPPTRGIFRGKAESELSVTVRVTPADVPPDADLLAESEWQPSPLSGYDPATGQQQQPQQQQQA